MGAKEKKVPGDLCFGELPSGPLRERLESASTIIREYAVRSVSLVVAFSGGKDSTATLVILLESLRRSGWKRAVDILYSDTGMEIPAMKTWALTFLRSLREVSGVPVRTHVVHPAISETYWTCVIGRGYPPPHQRFRWCTRRLKITPQADVLSFLPGPRTLVVGLRWNESAERNRRMVSACGRGGECGQGVWTKNSGKDTKVVAPIADWRECEVWDFLNIVATSWGWPTSGVEGVYGSRETRFGCWLCTVVRQDKALTSMHEAGHRWAAPMLSFRAWLEAFTRDPSNRVKRTDGKPGRLTLEARQEILWRLRELERITGLGLITEEEENWCRRYWLQEVAGREETNRESALDGFRAGQGGQVELLAGR